MRIPIFHDSGTMPSQIFHTLDFNELCRNGLIFNKRGLFQYTCAYIESTTPLSTNHPQDAQGMLTLTLRKLWPKRKLVEATHPRQLRYRMSTYIEKLLSYTSMNRLLYFTKLTVRLIVPRS